MTNLGIDEILHRLSSKFNKIIFDRDFVKSVNDDLQTIINDRSKCCVLVFPALSPYYLRLVKYQAKLCDLAVISLGGGSTKSIGVCLKKYYTLNHFEEVSKKPYQLINTQMMAETIANTTRKKRPPIQLYVPPAQRKSGTIVQKTELTNVKRGPITIPSVPTFELSGDGILSTIENISPIYCMEDLDCFSYNQAPQLHRYRCNCAKLLIFKDIFPYAELLVFSINRTNHSLQWDKMCLIGNKIVIDDSTFELMALTRILKNLIQDTSGHERLGLLTCESFDFKQLRNNYSLESDALSIYTDTQSYNCCCPFAPDCNVFNNLLKSNNCLHCLKSDEEGSFIGRNNDLDKLVPKSLEELEAVTETQSSKIYKLNNCDSMSIDVCAKPQSLVKENQPVVKIIPQQIDEVIVLDEKIEAPKIELKSTPTVEPKIKQNVHEQEKEIMRKAKQNINRKTRPIIKYVDDDNDTLKIERGDNVNNWEDLFNEEGELQEDIFSEITQKVGKDVTIMKAVEDYSAYASKQLEELEHMVELYDFPATLETHDIISAFKEINSEAMYVKWVDDTHALLVLGSYKQAQKAIELSNSLIKVRPMSAASKSALEKANQFDLKPAMKRPQTNLQTARRLITSHLGAKSRISKEQSAKEREDLRVAKELKRQAKQNEKDAWEGNLRSSIN